MARIYRCEFLGDSWGEWIGGEEMPPLPYEFEVETSTVTIASRQGTEWCYAYDPEAGLITWCTWEGDGWSEWHDLRELPPPPNWIVDEIESQFSMGAHRGKPVLYSYNPEDGSLFRSLWTGVGFSRWRGPEFIEPPPNMSEATDIFAAGDEESEWLIAVDLEEWSVFYTEWNPDEEEFSDWEEAPPLPIPDEWLDMGVDLDGDARDGGFWIYATVYEDIDY